MKLIEARNTIFQLIDKYSERGTVTPVTDANIADYNRKVPNYLDLAQKHIANIHPIVRQFAFSQYLPFDARRISEPVTHLADDLVFEVTGAKAYHYAVDGDCDVYLEGLTDSGWYTIEQFTESPAGEFERRKGFIDNPSAYKSVRLRFSGECFFTVKDVCLFTVGFSDYSKIPEVARYMNYPMPADFLYGISVELADGESSREIEDCRWSLDGKSLSVSSAISGEIRVTYASAPTTVNESTPGSYEFEVAPTLQGAMCYYAASVMTMSERPDVSGVLMQMYQESMLNFRTQSTAAKRIRRRAR